MFMEAIELTSKWSHQWLASLTSRIIALRIASLTSQNISRLLNLLFSVTPVLPQWHSFSSLHLWLIVHAVTVILVTSLYYCQQTFSCRCWREHKFRILIYKSFSCSVISNIVHPLQCINNSKFKNMTNIKPLWHRRNDEVLEYESSKSFSVFLIQ